MTNVHYAMQKKLDVFAVLRYGVHTYKQRLISLGIHVFLYSTDNVSRTIQKPRRPASHVALVAEAPGGTEALVLAVRAALQREPGGVLAARDEALCHDTRRLQRRQGIEQHFIMI